MGSLFSFLTTRFLSSKKAEPATKRKDMSLQRLVKPSLYAGNKRPSFAGAYARAARRYKFNIGEPIVRL
jgi:hypothetical protein